MAQYIVILVVIVGIVLYYFNYAKKIKAAGGSKEAGIKYWQDQFGLEGEERVVSMGIGSWYLGPLAPGTQRSTGEKVLDALTSTSYRGANLFLAFTSKDRLALAQEETDAGPKREKSSIGMKTMYGRIGVLEASARPLLETAAEAWPGSKDLPKKKDRPVRANLEGEEVTLELVRLTPVGHDPWVLYLEPRWIEAVGKWCRGGPALVEQRWVE
jgi:hypothetical protein